LNLKQTRSGRDEIRRWEEAIALILAHEEEVLNHVLDTLVDLALMENGTEHREETIERLWRELRETLTALLHKVNSNLDEETLRPSVSYGTRYKARTSTESSVGLSSRRARICSGIITSQTY